MKYRKRKFVPGECMHIYQRAVKGFNIFYDLEDYLVFYTIFAVVAKVYDISVLELCIMSNHVHILLSSGKLKEISDFIMHYTSMFVREYNDDVGRRGPLFHKSYGSAPKKGSKSIRSAIVYIGNNPVEKNLCQSADSYIWNFLSYMNPEGRGRFVIRKMTKRLQRAVREVSELHAKSAFLGYGRLRRLMARMSPEEKDILTDYIIYTYYPFDSSALLSYYDSYESMITAMRSTSGSEYDIKEMYEPEYGMIYQDMADLVRSGCSNHGPMSQVRKVTVMSADEKYEMARCLRRHTMAGIHQIERFLNITFERANAIPHNRL